MQMAELFDLSLRLYRTLGWRILKASVVPALFTLAGIAFLFQYVLPGFATTNQGTKASGQVLEATANLAQTWFQQPRTTVLRQDHDRRLS